MVISKNILRELLVGAGQIESADFERAEKYSTEKSLSVEQSLLDLNIIQAGPLGHIIADHIGYPYVNLGREKIEEHTLELIPETVARARGVIAFGENEAEIKLAMRDPYDLEMAHFIEKKSGKRVRIFYMTGQSVREGLSRYKVSLEEDADLFIEKLMDVDLGWEEKNNLNVEFVDLIMKRGYYGKSSDVHIEPYRNKVVVRFRIDGVLHTVLEIPKKLYDLVLSRIKIMSKMRIDEHASAQDGKFQFTTPDEDVDVRVSVVPVTEGENIVMRLLSSKSRQMDLSSLGINESDLDKVVRALKSPHGMILVTGPTGSGKTTTLYEFIKILNSSESNIATIEDPVEYDLEGVSQIQVNNKTNLTFANGLRAIVRQDPDIIMVGEIRDHETAGIAVNSGLTGHLVLSTIHANDAVSTLPRLLDMKIEPYLLASTIKLVIAQRLVRKICEKCRTSYTLSDEEKEMIRRHDTLKNLLRIKDDKRLDKMTLFKGAGCKVCAHTGYYGRLGVYEVLELSEDLRDLIIKRSNSDALLRVAKKNGMTTMSEDGINKVMRGVTTLSEVFRVAEIS